jgi:hypothetical protein
MSFASPSSKDKHLAGEADSVDSVTPSITESAGSPFILYHELDGNGKIVRSIGLDAGVFELISVVIAILVFWKIIRFIFDD